MCLYLFVVLVSLLVLAKRLTIKTPLRTPIRGKKIIPTKLRHIIYSFIEEVIEESQQK